MFTQPLNYGFFTVPFLLPPSSLNKVLYHLWQSQQRVRGLRGQAVSVHFFFPRGYFFVPRDDVVVLFAENSELETLN